MQSQINPHFLYNTLDTIRGMAYEEDCEDVAEIVGLLSSMFRYNMDFSSSLFSLKDEIEQVERYMKIQEKRFPGRYEFRQIYECREEDLQFIKIPKFTLQPIVENALSHGLKKKKDGGVLTIKYINTGCYFKIIISDNGIGMNEEVVNDLNRSFISSDNEAGSKVSSYSGIALPNVASRLRMYFGNEYGLHVNSTLDIGTDVIVTLPIENHE